MLTQVVADEMLEELKRISNPSEFAFPHQNEIKQMVLSGHDSKRRYIIDVNRKGQIRVSKCTYQNRVNSNIVLLRLDIDGPDHQNPDGKMLSRNHLHIYREGYGDRWAIEVPSCFIDSNDLIQTLINFLEYCKTTNYSDLKLQGMVF